MDWSDKFHQFEFLDDMPYSESVCDTPRINPFSSYVCNDRIFDSPQFFQINFYFVSEAPKFKNLFFFFFFRFFWGGTSQIFIFKQFSTHFFTEWMVYFSYMIRWFSFPEIYPVSWFFLIFPDFSGFSSNLPKYSLLCSRSRTLRI